MKTIVFSNSERNEIRNTENAQKGARGRWEVGEEITLATEENNTSDNSEEKNNLITHSQHGQTEPTDTRYQSHHFTLNVPFFYRFFLHLYPFCAKNIFEKMQKRLSKRVHWSYF